VGTVGTGYGADFVVVRGRPWLDVADLRVDGIVAVVSRGAVVAGSLPAA
jgi:imidazolonepropionase-like amidohydrolase